MKHEAKWIWYAEKCGVGSSQMLDIYEKFGSIGSLYLASYDEYIQKGVSERMAQILSDKSLDRTYDIIKFCENTGTGILTYSSENYPQSLRSLKDPPAVLYYAGNMPDLNNRLCIAAVGTRKMSEYGMRSAYKIAYEVASAGAVIVSGMALGIDAVAAGAAISARGTTVAVLGCGIDVIYPKEHSRLYNAICERGAVLSEYPPSTEPHGYNFPVRNRIISGLSQGTVVIDAGIKSGALITARTAILQGRDVYAVPSNIDSENSSGTNSLIRDGAQAVLCGYDIVKNYTYLFPDALDIQKLRHAEERSEYSASALYSLGIRARGEAPAFEGVSARVEREQGEALRQKNKTATHTGLSAFAKKSDTKKVTAQNTKKHMAELIVSDTDRTQEDLGDMSRAALESLSEKHRKIFDEMPIDKAISADYLVAAGFKLGEVISAFTVLEIKGLVSSLPGALYIRK